MTLKTMFLNLKVLSQMTAHGRLRKCTNGVLSLDLSEIPVYSGVKRYLLGEGRERTVQDISALVQDVQERSKALMDSRFLHSSDDTSHEAADVRNLLTQIAQDVTAACIGIQHLLTTTYARDATVTSELQLLLSRLRTVVSKINERL